MTVALDQHQLEIQANRRSWENKPLLRRVYGTFYDRIVELIDPAIPGQVLEIGSGIGNLKHRCPRALTSDLFPNPWLDLMCDGYDLPFRDASLSHILLFDVFHHLEAPYAFLNEARRALVRGGRLIIFDPYISLASHPVYGLLHHEPVAMGDPINPAPAWPLPRHYYAAQGNATRIFFRGEPGPWMDGWRVARCQATSEFAYLLCGGFSKPAMYPQGAFGLLRGVDRFLSRWPSMFGARCLVLLENGA